MSMCFTTGESTLGSYGEITQRTTAQAINARERSRL